MSMSAIPAAADVMRIGLLAPSEGSFSIFGRQARLAVEAFDRARQDVELDIVEAAEPCNEDNAADAATSLVEAGVHAVIGMFCAETIESAMPILASSDIPAITVSLRAGIVMEDALSREWPLFRLAPSAAAEPQTIADIIAERWVDEPFALIDDGTIYGRDLVETVRLELELDGITPAFMDVFRPAEELQFGLVRRLAGAGVSHVFVGGDRSDIAIMARDATKAGLDLTFMGGDAMQASSDHVPLRDGVYAVVADRAGAPGYSAEQRQAVRATLDAAGLPDMQPDDGYLPTAFAATQILLRAREEAEASSGQSLTAALRDGRFATVLGTLRFGNDQAVHGDIYRLMVSRNNELVPVSHVSHAPAVR